MLSIDITTRNAQAEVVRTAAVNGFVSIKTSHGQELARVSLGATPFNAASGGVTSLAAGHTATAVLAGTASYFELLRSDLSVILTGSIGVGVGDLQVDNSAVVIGDTFSLDGLSYVAPGV